MPNHLGPAYDYRKILLAYMRGIVRNEGIALVDIRDRDLTADEQRELFKIEDEIKADPAMKGYWA